MTLNLKAPYQQRCGRAARLLTTTLNNSKYPYAFAVEGNDGKEYTITTTVDGYFLDADSEGPEDIINVAEVQYLNVYKGPGGRLRTVSLSNHTTREEADRNAMSGRVACKRIEVTEGEYDE